MLIYASREHARIHLAGARHRVPRDIKQHVPLEDFYSVQLYGMYITDVC